MPRHNFRTLKGRVEVVEIASDSLRKNLLGDPAVRQVAVYLPENYDSSREDWPLLVDVVGFTGSGFSHLNWRGFSESVPQKIDRLIENGAMGPVICAFPDCFTSLGGNQYINSEAMGYWADFLIKDMIPMLESRFRVKKGRQHRAIFGKSSGGYGALAHGIRYPEAWGALACHSGDMAFEWVYLSDMPRTLNVLAKYGGVEGLVGAIQKGLKISSDEMHTLMILAMAATYDPDPESYMGIRLPVDMRSCALITDRWENWLAHDPVRLIDEHQHQEALKRMKLLFIDCGDRDQYHLHYGARQLVGKLNSYGVPHLYQEFPDNHSDINYRMDVSLPKLYEAIR